MGLVYHWAGKCKHHYFDDIENCVEVVASELGYNKSSIMLLTFSFHNDVVVVFFFPGNY
jgi:hypothetical protein